MSYAPSEFNDRFRTAIAWDGEATINGGTAVVGTYIEFPLPLASGAESLSLAVMRTGATPVQIGNPIPVAIGASAPRYLIETVDDGQKIYGVWSIVSRRGPRPAPLATPESITVTASVAGIVWPANIPDGHITWAPKSDGWILNAAGIWVRQGTMTLTSSLAAEPAGFRRRFVRGDSATPNISAAQTINGAAPAGANIGWTAGAAATWNSGNGTPDGTDNWLNLFWEDIASGEMRVAREALKFTSRAPVITTPSAYNEIPSASVTAGAATVASIQALIDARVAAGTGGAYYIDIPNGNYGAAVINRKAASNQTIYVRSVNKGQDGTHIPGAKFTSIDLNNCEGIVFQYVDVDRNAVGFIQSMVTLFPSKRCGIEYSRIRTRAMPAGGWASTTYTYKGETKIAWTPHCTRGVTVGGSVTGNLSEFNSVRFNEFYGHFEDALYSNGAFDCIYEGNVFRQGYADDIKISWGARNTIRDNWASRDEYHGFNPANGQWSHNDFIQTDVGGATISVTGNVYDGNVLHTRSVGGGMGQLPIQGTFASTLNLSDVIYRDNIAFTQTVNGHQFSGQGSGNIARNNTAVRLIDYVYPEMNGCYFSAGNGADISQCLYNVECKQGAGAAFGVDGLRIVMNGTDYTASRTYYNDALREGTFYSTRPKDTSPTTNPCHHSYSGGPAKGAHEKWRKTIVDKKGYARTGPGRLGWKEDYDWLNEVEAA